MKALVGAFNQEKALEGAFSVIVQPVVEPMEHYTALSKDDPAQKLLLWRLLLRQLLQVRPGGQHSQANTQDRSRYQADLLLFMDLLFVDCSFEYSPPVCC